jgi:hypothetical protein
MRVAMLSSLLLVVLPAVAATGKDAVLSSGLCEQQVVDRKYDQPQSTAGYATEGPLTITQLTDTIPLKQGVAFGFSWRVEGLPPIVRVKYVVEHPLITRPDGKQIQSFEEPMEHETVRGVLQTTDCYSLSEDHELVPGDWSLSIVHNGTLLAKRTYHVVRQP